MGAAEKRFHENSMGEKMAAGTAGLYHNIRKNKSKPDIFAVFPDCDRDRSIRRNTGKISRKTVF